jgi:hypothetical protein
VAVVKMHQKIVKMPQSEATKLRTKVAELKSDRRSLSTQLTNLQNRTAKLVEYLDEHIVPKQKTLRRKRLNEAITPVRNLLW